MRNQHYARKRRQLKTLSVRLQVAISERAEQQIEFLSKRIKQLLQELRAFVSVQELRKALGGLAFLFGLAASHNSSAQVFGTPVVNPFGLDSLSYYAMPAVADLDGDGDLDILAGEEYGVMQYFENTGTASNPQFASPVANPFGISITTYYYARPVFADIDGDGDQDLFVGDFYGGGLLYQENTGSATSPQFAMATANPFGFATAAYAVLPTFVDLDDDGDLDLFTGEEYGIMRYFQNTGTASSPQFAAPQQNPFGITSTYYFAAPTFADLDKDGDQDLLVGEYYGAIQYFENTGTKTAPMFATAQQNPFGLTSSVYAAFPVVADLDNDGDLDLLVGEYYGTFRYFENMDPIASIAENDAFKLSIAPNPAQEYFTLNTTEVITSVQILDLQGRLLKDIKNPEGNLDVSEIPKGSYLIKVINRDNQAQIEKLIKE